KLHESPGALGGHWDVHEPHNLENGTLTQVGGKGSSVLRGIPVKAGVCYRISYEATGLDDARSDTGFHEIKTTITPAVQGKFGFNDARNFPQRKFQDFTIPQDFPGKAIDFALTVTTGGSVRFRDFQLEERPADPTEGWRMFIESPFYRGAIFDSDPEEEIRLKVLADGAARRVKARLSIPDSGALAAEVPLQNGTARLAFPPWRKGHGKAALTVDVLDEAGKALRTFHETIRRLEAQPREVKAHPNGYFTCNGEWLFPIVAFDLCTGKTSQEIHYLAQNGFTLIRHNYNANPADGLKALEAARECGVKLVLYTGFPHRLADVQKYRERLERGFPPEIRNHPAFFGYFIADEPLWGGVPAEVFRAVHDIHLDFDPAHPTWINAAPRNEVADLRPFGAACDIYGVDIYPVPWPNNHSGLEDKTLTACGKYAQRMRETVDGRKPVINWLQGFSWHEFGDDRWAPKTPKPHPTLMQSRFMVYDTLLNGGNGYGIYGLRYALQNRFIEEIMQVAREVNGMSRLFVEGERLPDPKTDTPSIRVCTIRHKGRDFFFVLNLTDKPTRGAVTGQEMPVGLHDYQSGAEVDFARLELPGYGVLTCGPALPPSVNPIPPPIPQLAALGSPFPDYIERKRQQDSKESYAGKASWIWDNDSVAPGGECFVWRSFEAKPGEKAVVLFTADDLSTLYVNGAKVATQTSWDKMVRADVTPRLRPGLNHILIHARDAGGLPCGLLAEIRIGGHAIVTDTGWLTLPCPPGTKTPPAPEEFTGGRPAKIIAPYGGGAWGRKVKIQ
ncbi:MAG: hypothetical protein IJJ33_17145, partial [Victivallales bacterium]|nr:hypothetical protein [Victivallales bacterium]